VRDSVESGEKDGDDGELAVFVRRARPDGGDGGRGAGFRLGGGHGGGALRKVEEDVDDVLVLRRLVGGEGLALCTTAYKHPSASRFEVRKGRGKRTRSTHLRSDPLLVVNDDTPREVHLIVLNPDETTGLKERQSVSRVVENVAKVLVEEVELLTELVVVGDVVFVGDDDRRSLFVEGAEFCDEGSKGRR
jgi:hypothetical protein